VFSKFLYAFLGAFEDDDIVHVDGEVNPVRDFETISEELRLKDEEYVLSNLEKLERTVIRGNDKKGKPEYVSYLLIRFKVTRPNVLMLSVLV